MQWEDEGIVLSFKAIGENKRILSLFTSKHGKHLGIIHGRSKNRFEIGTVVKANWRARLEEQIGYYNCEIKKKEGNKILSILGNANCLYALSSLCDFIDKTLPEREIHENFYNKTILLIENIGKENWLQNYIKWEILLLKELGFGLNLLECAVTKQKEKLCYVSPKTGRAVSSEPAAPYKERLLKLPPFLTNQTNENKNINKQIIEGFNLTGHFILNHVFNEAQQKMPPSRNYLIKSIENKYDT